MTRHRRGWYRTARALFITGLITAVILLAAMLTAEVLAS